MTVKLDDAVYYRLRWLKAEQEKVTTRVLLAQAQESDAIRRFQQALSDAARAHGFDADTPYRWDDAHTSLVSE